MHDVVVRGTFSNTNFSFHTHEHFFVVILFIFLLIDISLKFDGVRELLQVHKIFNDLLNEVLLSFMKIFDFTLDLGISVVDFFV